MSFLRHQELLWLAENLRPWLAGSRIQKVRRYDDCTLVLQCHRPSQPFDLILSTRPEVARLSVDINKRVTVSAQDTFATWVKSNLKGHRIIDLQCDEEQKLIFLSIGSGTLVLELFGHQPRIVGLDAERVVRSCTPSKLRKGLRMGHPYEVPAFDGAVVVKTDSERRYDSIEYLESRAAQLEKTLHRTELEQRRQALIRRARKQFQRLEKKLLTDQAGLGVGETWKKLGELLKSEVWRLNRGMESIEVTDYFDTEMPSIEIKLDPKLNGPENIERYFKRYRRGISGHAQIQKRLESVAAKQKRLAVLEQSENTLETLQSELRKLGVRLRQLSAGSSKRPKERKPYHEFWSIQSERIYVGRGGIDNHQTTFRIGKGNDHWLHVKDAPGAHVIIPVAKGTAPHPDTILDALALAVHYSKLRGEPDAWVTHTQRKYVRPVPGGSPGRVIVQSEKVKQVSGLAMRITRLFEEREQRGDR